MTYDEFKTAVCKKISTMLPSDTSIQLQKIYKNNGLELDGLIISRSKCNISPTIFLNYYYEKQSLFPNLDAVCQDILRTYAHNRASESIDVSFFTDYESVRHHLAFRIINYEKNKELLQTVPHVRYLDLAIVFYCLLKVQESGNATILIHSRHMELWNVSTDDLYNQTCKTTPHLLPYDFRNMSSVLFETFSKNGKQDISALPDGGDFWPMYVLSNTDKLYGASCMLYPCLLNKIAGKLDADLFLLPSSIHEIIILPAQNRGQSAQLSQMVSDINHTELSADEVLSDHVYYYSKSEQALCICPYESFS